MRAIHRHKVVGVPVLSSAAKMQQSPITLTRFLCAFIAVATVYVVGIRLQVAANAPLWIDETWSAMIATRPDWPTFWHEAWLDCNPPLYYLFLTGWVGVFGDSNLMLRLPSFLFVILAAALPLVWRPQGLNRAAAWTWAGLLLLWPPGMLMMLDARGYALMLLLSTASCLVVAQLLQHLSLKGAVAWVTLGTMMFLTHYYAAVLVTAQTFALIYQHRTRLLRVWPATLIALPGLAWFAHHLPRLRDYARPDVAWQQRTGADSAVEHFTYIFGAWNYVSLSVIAVILGFAVMHRRRANSEQNIGPIPVDHNLTLVAGTAVIGFGLALLIGAFQASLVSRYLVPLVPPVMLGFTLIIQSNVQQGLHGVLLVFFFMLPGLNVDQTRNASEMRAMYGFEQASEFASVHKLDQLLFLWDHPAAKILDRQSLEHLGSYFVKRNNIDVPVRALIVSEDDDANGILRSAAKGRRSAVIWLYNTADRTAARAHRPTFENDPAWICRNRGPETVRTRQLGAISCINLEKAGD